MDNGKAGATGGGIGLSGCTFIVFLVLKLCGVIDWSWWWVTSPLWIPLAAVIGICIVLLVVGFCIGTIRAIYKLIRGKNNE